MKQQSTSLKFIGILLLGVFLSLGSKAQGKQQYSSLSEALRSAGNLYGKQGPQSVNWTNGGDKYSYINNDEIHSLDPKTLTDEMIFDNKGHNFPGTNNPFNYDSFQWSHDSKHLVFKTNFRPNFFKSSLQKAHGDRVLNL